MLLLVNAIVRIVLMVDCMGEDNVINVAQMPLVSAFNDLEYILKYCFLDKNLIRKLVK